MNIQAGARRASLLLGCMILTGALLSGCKSEGSGSAEGSSLQTQYNQQPPAEIKDAAPQEEGAREDLQAASPEETPSGSAENPQQEAAESPGTEAAPDPQTDPQADRQPGEETDHVTAMRIEQALQATVREQSGQWIVTNESSPAVVVNKQRSLPEGYEPADLREPKVPFSFSEPHEKRLMRTEAAAALEELFAAAEKDGMELRAISGYRSYERQQSVYQNHVRTKGEAEAARISALPGTSEHQTGLAMDVSSPSAGNELSAAFGETAEGKWLAQHAPEYGFIIRYPQGEEDVTGYVYEPWHLRYVGKDLALDIAESGLTLEEYLDADFIKL
ncbi:peptidase M15B and M15C DD-carboxypeptidase VanY/endolysin [Paenibacillus algicola]|uniref:Peptidase M15B and M15C DD-carboxypeptidase VanY/endolysin n=1 Tax=Paenibacillus algicola TaxID=2565926 RepID=A0A4P8XFR6_9BACL|nr:M15 family metallopeptidase [Paenibacillus algicola]QCT01246.1 peptidase M15B and M15C DD-carboxypeptidase VanY/endolysin [Paenibacillus algicola]